MHTHTHAIIKEMTNAIYYAEKRASSLFMNEVITKNARK